MTAWVRSVVATACIAVAGLLAPAGYCADHSPNLVVNGDFSADGGSLDGWTYNNNANNIYWQFTTDGTIDYAYNGCTGAVCITGTEEQQNYLYQTVQTRPDRLYKLTFTYDAGTGGVNELQVLLKDKVKKDLVNLASGATKYTVYFIAHSHETKLNFLGRQNNGFSFLTNISVVHVIHKDDSDE